ncbi:MAG: acetyl-CoA carboxylase biotin carboxyl carrier protein [Pseudomonadota bacterium]
MDLRKVKKLIELVEESGIQELEVASGDESIRISMPVSGVAARMSTVPVSVTTQVESPMPSPANAGGGIKIHAPMAGTFYVAPHPDAPPFVEAGSQVNAGDVVCIIESMKMMHEIRAEKGGILEIVAVENGQPIGTGDVLFHLS